jgi:hypothetical protein
VALPLDVAGPEHPVERLVVDDEDGCPSRDQVNSCSAAQSAPSTRAYSSSIRGSSSAAAMSVPAFLGLDPGGRVVLLWLVERSSTRSWRQAEPASARRSGGGLLAFFGLPILAVIALVTIVGIPLGLGVLAALGLIYALGYSATAWILGRRIVRQPTGWVLAFLAGWAILRLVALVPILGGRVWFAAVVFGLGALLVAVWRGRSAARATTAAA